MIERNQTLLRFLLWVPAKLYELGVRLRVAAYETAYLKAKKLDATVISVGNITLGGTGKTPFVEFIARYLKQEGHSVAILTRGYSRSSRHRRVLNGRGGDYPSAAGPDKTMARDVQQIRRESPPGGFAQTVGGCGEFGDEPVMLARSLTEVPVVIDKDRFAAGKWSERHLGANVLVLDDGYQHLALRRDLNILLLDATDPFGQFEMAPFGRLREPLYGLKRADAIIINRAHRAFDQGQVLAIIKLFCGDRVPIMYFHSTIVRLRNLSTGDVYESSQFRGWNVALMCGIGNPHAFADDVLQIGINIVSEDFFPDHHAFDQEDLNRISESARSLAADAILTTEKDAVRLEGLDLGEVPIYAAQLDLHSDDEVRLKSLLLRTVVTRRG